MDALKTGFCTSNDGATNRAALQNAIDSGERVTVSVPGEYLVEGTIYLHSGSHIVFNEGVSVKRMPEPDGKNGYFMVNDGAFTGIPDCNITVEGLNLFVNGVESASGLCVDALPSIAGEGEEALNSYFDRTVLGLRAHIAFRNVKNLKVHSLVINDLCSWDYGVQISEFDTVELDNVHIEGNKDAIHFGPGKNFILRNGVFRTKDDPIALNADDYSPSASDIGTIENGLIENCIDLSQNSTYGYFVRLLIGTVSPWKEGMTVKHSDSVIHNGRLYRAVLPSDGTTLISQNPPEHDKGFRIIDSIPWIFIKDYSDFDEIPMKAEINNVTFKNLISEKKRKSTVILYVGDNCYHRGRREDGPIPKIRNITFENLNIKGDTENAFYFCAPFENLIIKNCDLNNSAILFEQGSCGIGKYPASFTLENVRNFSLSDRGAFEDNSEKYDTIY